MKIIYTRLFIVCLGFLALVGNAKAQQQEIFDDFQGTYNARVVEISASETVPVGWKNIDSVVQIIKLELLSGDHKGEIVTITSDFPQIKNGTRVFVNHTIDQAGEHRYHITNIDRRMSLYFFVGLFIVVVIAFGGRQGVRSLVALIGSFAAIFYILIPGILAGWHPLMASSLVASAVLFAAIFLTHGFHREAAVAYIGTMISVTLTSVLAILAVSATKLTGFSGDEAFYLNISTGGELNFTGLLLGAIIIGILGVLDDIAVTQSAVVSELYATNPAASSAEVYRRAMRVGREHVSALVNTLVLAYTGSALLALMLFTVYEYNFATVINLEVIATEIIRMIIGSIGLIMTVPIVTFLAVVYLKGRGRVSEHGHAHSHCHHE